MSTVTYSQIEELLFASCILGFQLQSDGFYSELSKKKKKKQELLNGPEMSRMILRVSQPESRSKHSPQSSSETSLRFFCGSDGSGPWTVENARETMQV